MPPAAVPAPLLAAVLRQVVQRALAVLLRLELCGLLRLLLLPQPLLLLAAEGGDLGLAALTLCPRLGLGSGQDAGLLLLRRLLHQLQRTVAPGAPARPGTMAAGSAVGFGIAVVGTGGRLELVGVTVVVVVVIIAIATTSRWSRWWRA